MSERLLKSSRSLLCNTAVRSGKSEFLLRFMFPVVNDQKACFKYQLGGASSENVSSERNKPFTAWSLSQPKPGFSQPWLLRLLQDVPSYGCRNARACLHLLFGVSLFKSSGLVQLCACCHKPNSIFFSNISQLTAGYYKLQDAASTLASVSDVAALRL